MATFKIQDQSFEAPLDPRVGSGFEIRSSPRNYRVEISSTSSPGEVIAALTQKARHPLLIVDKRVAALHLDHVGTLTGVPRLDFEALEGNKNLSSVLRLIDFLDEHRVTKSSTLFVVGGGITQDVAAVAASLYKRGIPWTFAPSTLLAQGDSGIGSKSALNHGNAKNQLGLFSAPRNVLMHSGFLDSLAEADLLSGMGEIFRLHVTGGAEFLTSFERELPAAREGSLDAIRRLLLGALSVKRAVIEVDEFEVDLRRSLNFGHSFGHALEKLVDFRIPHGTAVTLGMLVENEIAVRRGILSHAEHARIVESARLLVTSQSRKEFASASLTGLLDLLRRDKKAEGDVLKLVVLESVGQIRFIDFELNQAAEAILVDSVKAIVDVL